MEEQWHTGTYLDQYVSCGLQLDLKVYLYRGVSSSLSVYLYVYVHHNPPMNIAVIPTQLNTLISSVLHLFSSIKHLPALTNFLFVLWNKSPLNPPVGSGVALPHIKLR